LAGATVAIRRSHPVGSLRQLRELGPGKSQTLEGQAEGTHPTAKSRSPGVTYFIVEPNHDQLVELARLADEGAIRPEIDSVFPLADARAAFDRVAERGKRGKVVLRVAGS
jgi:NADPH:quinone reductase-like Zn-dependent oxidoreductase